MNEAARVKATGAARAKANEAARVKAKGAARAKAEEAARAKAKEAARAKANEGEWERSECGLEFGLNGRWAKPVAIRVKVAGIMPK